ncbi:membrane dipeptidase [Rhizobiales bacterium GAS113]|nr:membrane dipeptidase [Rhizobiales bacterium GAS113]
MNRSVSSGAALAQNDATAKDDALARDKALAHAHRLLDKLPLVDGHNDLPFVINRDSDAKGDVRRYDLARQHQRADTDIPRLKAGRLSAQIWAAFIPTKSPHPARTVLELIDTILQLHEAYPDVFMRALSAADIGKAKRQGKIASFLAVEGGVGLENSLSPLRVWQAAGARLMTLCHNETLDWVDSATDVARHKGLTAFGRAVVAELNRLGMMVDLAHVSPDVMRQVLDITRAPVVFSHSNARALADHPRNVPDDVLDRIPANGGIVMATFVPDFISRRSYEWMMPFKDEFGKTRHDVDMTKALPDRERQLGKWPRGTMVQLCDHIDYIVKRIGIDHVGIGSDFYGGPTPDGLEDVSRFPYLLAELIRRGYTDTAIAKIASRNFVRVFRAVERAGKTLRETEAPRVGRLEDFDGK